MADMEMFDDFLKFILTFERSDIQAKNETKQKNDAN